jgi:hypothetical protein
VEPIPTAYVEPIPTAHAEPPPTAYAEQGTPPPKERKKRQKESSETKQLKRKWLPTEDEILASILSRLMADNLRVDWSAIARELSDQHLAIHGVRPVPRKTNRQCNQRWNRGLHARLVRLSQGGSHSRRTWTPSEDQELLEVVEKVRVELNQPDYLSIPWSVIARRHSALDVNDHLVRSRFKRLTTPSVKNRSRR